MHRFYAFLDEHRVYVTLGGVVLLSLVLMTLAPTQKLVLARGITAGLLKVGHMVFAWPMDLSHLRYENRVLREQNLRISLELL